MTNKLLFNRSGMSPDVTCRKGRHAIESIVSRLCLASLICLCMLTVSSGNVWGADPSWTWTAGSASDFGTSTSGNVTLNGKTWSVTRSSATNEGSLNNSCVQLGAKNRPQTITLSTSAFSSYKVTKVEVECSSYGGNHSVAISVGGTSYLAATSTDSWTTVGKKSGTGTSTGNIEIAFTKNNSARALYIKSITVTYTTASCTTLSAPGSPSSTPYETSVDLSWNSVANSSGYLVTFGGTEYNIASGTTTKTITGLKKEKTYAWTVAAKGDGTTYCALGTATSEQSVTTLDGCSDSKVTYTVASTSSVTPSGAPAGTSASYSSTYSSKYQLTSGNSMTLTLTGYAGKKIKGLTLDMRSNGSAGAGTFSMVIGSSTVASISSATAFDEWYDNDSYGTDYRKVHVTLSDEVTVGMGESIVITIAATTNSLYCQGFALCYSSCTPLGSINGSVSWNNPTEAVLTWNKLDDQVSAWALSWSPNTAGSSITSAIADLGETQKTATVSGLACNTEYTFTFTPTLKSGVCTPASNPTKVSTSTKYSITLTDGGLPTGGVFTSDVDASADDEHACADDVIELEAAPNTGYQFDGWEITYTSGGADAWDDVIDTGDEDDDDIIITMPAADITVNAVFTCISTTATVGPTSGAGNYGWRYTTGETIDLTCSVSGATPTAYQWQKYVGSVWTDINKATNASAGTARLQIASCTSSDGGSYRCVVTTGTGCSIESDGGDGYFVRIFTLDGNYSGSSWTKNAITWTGENTGTVTLSLNESSIYMFKVTDNDGKWFGNGTNNYIIQPVNWNCYTGNSDMRLFTGPAGNYMFTLDVTNAGAGSPYVNVQVAYPSVTHPAEGYVYVSKWWNCYPHFWDGSGNGLTPDGYDPQIETYTTICENPYWYFPLLNTYVNVAVKDNATWASAGNNSGNQTMTDHSGMYLTHSGSWGWHDFETYTITFAGNGNSGGSMSNVSGICPNGSRTLAENGYTLTGYHFNGWKTNTAITINTGGEDEAVAVNGIVPDEATIKTINSSITLTAQWAANTNTTYTVKHYKQKLDGTYDSTPDDTDNLTGTTATNVTPDRKSYTGFTAPDAQTVSILADGSRVVTYQYTRNSYTLTWVLNGGTVTTAGTCAAVDDTGSPYGSVKFGASITAPVVQKTGYNMTWSSSPAATMPAANTTYTANWSANSYDVTLKANGGSSADQVVSATYGSPMPTTVKAGTDIVAPTYNGYTFAGYYDTDASTGGTQYYTNALGSANNWDKASNANLYGRWTANQYTVTLDANGGVDGATTSVNTTFGQAMPTIAAANLPTRDGYRFDGFYTEKSSGTKYYNADGTSAKSQARYSDNQKLYAHWVAQLTFSVNGVIDGALTRDDNTAMPSSATIPTACGDCWVFLGWSTDSDEDEAAEYAGGATHEFGAPQTLYAVYGKTEYEYVHNLSDLVNNEYYILTAYDEDDNECAMANSLETTYNQYANKTDITSDLKHNADGWFLYNPDPSIVWKFTGTKDAGRLYNEAANKYLDLSDDDAAVLQSSTSDYLKFTKFNDDLFDIASTTTTTNYLYLYKNVPWGVDNEHDGFSSCFIYKRQSTIVTTSPSCETYDIVWKVNGTPTSAGGPTDETNTCAGIETLPTDPANNTLACANVFMGWSEEDLSGPDNEEPDDLFWRSGDAPKITGDKIFNAVFATGTPVANTYKLTSLSNIKDGQTVLIVNHTNNVAVSSTASGTKLSSVSVSPSEETITTSETSIKWTVTKSGDYYVFKSGDNYLRSGGSNLLYCDGTSDKWSISSGTVSGTYLMTSYNNSSYSLEYYNSNFTSYSGTGNAYNVEFYVQAMTYSDYMTNCCTAYTISGASKNGTDVIVSGNTGGTLTSNYNRACAEASVTLSATINPGYAFGGWTITGATSGDLTSTLLPGDNATSLTPAAFEMPGENITVSATITEKTATAWTWTYKSGAIPNPLVMYVNEYHQLDVTYVPSDLLDGQKNYAVTKESSVAQVSKQLAYYKMRGAVGVTSATSSTVTFTLGGLRQDVNVTVKPLPIVTFVDIVHNKTDFANAGSGYTAATGVLTSTVSDGVVTHTQPTPTHSKLDVPGSGNDCELTHLVLIGWIRSDCPDVDNYMRGLGAKPGNAAITGAGNDGEGRAYFVSAGADIDVEDYNTLTFYAVWAKVE